MHGSRSKTKMNESIRDLLKPKDEKDILKSLMKLPPREMLITSINNGILEGIKKALKRGVDINYWDGYPIQYACIKGDLSIVKFLIENGGWVRAAANRPLLFAVSEKHLDVIKYLVEKGADAYDPSVYEEIKKLKLSPNNRIKKYFEKLVKARTDNWPLHNAILDSNEDAIECLLELGADLLHPKVPEYIDRIVWNQRLKDSLRRKRQIMMNER